MEMQYVMHRETIKNPLLWPRSAQPATQNSLVQIADKRGGDRGALPVLQGCSCRHEAQTQDARCRPTRLTAAGINGSRLSSAPSEPAPSRSQRAPVHPASPPAGISVLLLAPNLPNHLAQQPSPLLPFQESLGLSDPEAGHIISDHIRGLVLPCPQPDIHQI